MLGLVLVLVLDGVCSVRGGVGSVIVVLGGFRVVCCVTTHQCLVSSLQETLLISQCFFLWRGQAKTPAGFHAMETPQSRGVTSHCRED